MKHVPRIYSRFSLFKSAKVKLSDDDAHHLINVMRVKDQQKVKLFNAQYGEWNATMQLNKSEVTCICKEQIRPPRDEPGFTLIFPIISPQKMHIILEKSTELGVESLMPIITQYTQNQSFNEEKAYRIVIDAAEQCGRLSIPRIEKPVRLNELLSNWDHNITIMVGDLTGECSGIDKSCSCFLIGPEGGFSDSERQLFSSSGFVHVTRLCSNILRAETAALAFGANWAANHICD